MYVDATDRLNDWLKLPCPAQDVTSSGSENNETSLFSPFCYRLSTSTFPSFFSPNHADKDAGVTDQNDVVKEGVWEKSSYKDG